MTKNQTSIEDKGFQEYQSKARQLKKRLNELRQDYQKDFPEHKYQINQWLQTAADLHREGEIDLLKDNFSSIRNAVSSDIDAQYRMDSRQWGRFAQRSPTQRDPDSEWER